VIGLQREDGVAVLTLQHATRGNALGAELVEALIAAVEVCIADTALHTLVLAAEGADFCTGFDLGGLPATADLAPGPAADGPLLWRLVRVEHLLSLLWHAPLRTVALAQGRAFGAGADLFATCDLRLLAADAQLRFPGAAFGIVLGTRRLAQRVGEDRALEWVSTGTLLDADAALRDGLATGRSQPGAWRAHVAPLSVDRGTYAALRAAARPDARDADLTALVRSAGRPGLAGRLARYRDGLRRPPRASP